MAVTLHRSRFRTEFMVSGVRYRETFASLVEAQAWELKARADLLLGKPVPKPTLPLREVASLDTMAGLYEHTSKVHWTAIRSGVDQRRNAKRFLDFVGPKISPVGAYTTEQLGAYVAELRHSRCSNGTINRHLSALSKMARIAWKARLLSEMPEIPWQKEGVGRTRTYTKDEVAAIIKLANQFGYEREADLFQFLIDTGCRLGEAGKVRWEDFGKDFASVTFHGDITKTGTDRTIPLFPSAQLALKRRRLASAGDRGPFTGVNSNTVKKQWYRVRSKLELGDDATLHTFRHTRATWFAADGFDFWRIQKWMGHLSLSTTRRYTHLVSNDLDVMAKPAPLPSKLDANELGCTKA